MHPALDPSFLADLGAALLLRRTRLAAIERGSRTELLDAQRRRSARLLAHAAERSPFYRERFGGRPPRGLEAVEPVHKAELFGEEGFDRAVTVPGLTLAWARSRLQRAPERQRGRFVVVSTSGTTGRPAVVPFTRRDWREGMAYVLRSADLVLRGALGSATALLGLLVDRPRVAGVATQNPIHVSTQMAASFHLGLVPRLVLPASAPLPEQVRRLNAFRPTVLGGYPSAVRLLAAAAREGSLSARPSLVFCGGETVTPGLRAAVGEAWGVELFDSYGLSETLVIAGECRMHQGMHLFEDAVVMEVVDDRGRVLPAGETGAGVLLTSLVNRTLPVIRYFVSDRVTLTDEPCACGLPFRRILAIEGRQEELLTLRRAGGGEVRVHPFVLETPLEELGAGAFELVEEGGGVCVRLEGTDPAFAANASRALAAALEPLGVAPEAVRVELAAELDERRGATDKRLR